MGKSSKRKRSRSSEEEAVAGPALEDSDSAFRRPEGSPLRKRHKKEKKKKRKREREERERTDLVLPPHPPEEVLENVPTSPSSSIPSVDWPVGTPLGSQSGPSLFSDLTSNVTRVRTLPSHLRLDSPDVEVWLVRKPRGVSCGELGGGPVAEALGGDKTLLPGIRPDPLPIGTDDYKLSFALAKGESSAAFVLRPVEDDEEEDLTPGGGVLLGLGPRLKGIVSLLPHRPDDEHRIPMKPEPSCAFAVETRREPKAFSALRQRFRPFGLLPSAASSSAQASSPKRKEKKKKKKHDRQRDKD